MKTLRFVVSVLALVAAPTQANPKIDIHGLVRGGEGARFIKGIPTLEMPLNYGAVQVRPLGFDHNDTVFAVAVFNAGSEPANIALEDMRADVGGTPVRIWTGQDLARQAKNRAMWAQIGIAFLSAAGSALAASQRDTYHSTLYTPHGSYSFNSSYPSIAGQLAARDIANSGVVSMGLIQQRLDMALANIDANVVQRTTVDPGMAYGAIVVVDKVDYGKAPLELHLSVDWNGERYPFAFLLTKTGRAVPAEYTSLLAENKRPMSLDQRWSTGSPATSSRTATSRVTSNEKLPEGAVFLASGAVKVPAKTRSGFCLRAPRDYVGTGDENYPAITGGMPRCEDVVNQPKKALWQSLN
jgi:hypothetical protein